MSVPAAPMKGGEPVDGLAKPRNSTVVNEVDASSHEAAPGPAVSYVHDPSVSFEEYMYYAEITRREEEAANALYLAARSPTTLKSLVADRFRKGNNTPSTAATAAATGDAAAHEKAAAAVAAAEKDRQQTGSDSDVITGVTDAEWKQASRAVRTAGWGGVFYLITTDILGPASAPYVFIPSLLKRCQK